MANVEIQGLASLYRKLNKLSEINGYKAMKTAVGLVHSQAVNNANFSQGYQTGELRSSIHSTINNTSTGLEGKVYTNNDHAMYVEFGTGQRGTGSYPYAGEADVDLAYREDWAGMKAQPYMYPAYKTHETTIKDLFKKELRSELKSVSFKGGK